MLSRQRAGLENGVLAAYRAGKEITLWNHPLRIKFLREVKPEAKFAVLDHFAALRFGIRSISSLQRERRPRIDFTRFFPRCMLSSASAISDFTMRLWFNTVACLALLSCSSCEQTGNRSEPWATPARTSGGAEAPPPASDPYRTAPVPPLVGEMPPLAPPPVVAPGSSPATPSIEQY